MPPIQNYEGPVHDVSMTWRAMGQADIAIVSMAWRWRAIGMVDIILLATP